MKFIHAADLHLDSPFLGLKQLPDQIWQMLLKAPFTALTRMVDDAINSQVDFMVISGDIYDREERSIGAQAAFLAEMERLDDANIPVYLSYGNHDFLNGSADNLQLPGNVHVFDETVSTTTVVTKAGEKVQLSGFSYPTRAVTTDMVPQFPARLPDADIAIGLLHGSLAGGVSGHDTYAPFTISELQTKQYDYWALGHIHKRQVLQDARPWIIYPGNLQGRHVNETGEKGYYLVSSDNAGNLTSTFKSVAPIIWQTVMVDAANWRDSNDVLTGLKNLTETSVSDAVSLQLLAVTLTHANKLSDTTQARLIDGSLLALAQQQASNQRLVVRIGADQEETDLLNMPAIDQKYWLAAADKVFSEENIMTTAGQLLREPMLQHIVSEDRLKNAASGILQQGQAGEDDE